MGVAVFESCMMTMDVDSRELGSAGNSSSVRNLDIDKGGPVMVLMIIVVRRIRRSRHEEVYGSQFKWAINKSQRNAKAMGCQLEEEAYKLP